MNYKQKLLLILSVMINYRSISNLIVFKEKELQETEIFCQNLLTKEKCRTLEMKNFSVSLWLMSI